MYSEYHPYLCWLAQIRGIGRKGIFALLQAAGETSLFSSGVMEISDPSDGGSVPAASGADQSFSGSGQLHNESDQSLSGSGQSISEPDQVFSGHDQAYPGHGRAGCGFQSCIDLAAAARILYTASEDQISFLCGEAFSNDYRRREARKLLLENRKRGREPDRIAEELQKADIGFSCILEEGFPQRLRQIPDPPFGIYYRGGLPGDAEPAAAVIGARLASGYGKDQARSFSRTIASRGIVVISGMARGIDGIAQRAALDVRGRSYAVLGCGVDLCYPEENRDLYERLLQEGGILSEYPPGTFPEARLFPQRNRIISGLADLVLVIEARKRSGTLITVDMALEQGREVYALPGRVCDSLSDGCNRLIRQGAVPATSPKDILEYFFGTGVEEAGTDHKRNKKGGGLKHAALQEKVETADSSGKLKLSDTVDPAGKVKISEVVDSAGKVKMSETVDPAEMAAGDSTMEKTEDPEMEYGLQDLKLPLSLEKRILQVLSAGDEMHVDRILEAVNGTCEKAEQDQVRLSNLLSVLTRMKIDGLLEEALSGYYRRVSCS